MGLRFIGDAIELSGTTGTLLKSEIIGEYYPAWWKITSGGESRNYEYETAIIELNAGTGEDYITDIKETILGSSGHALDLKGTNPNTQNLKLVLVEEDKDCFLHLKNVVKRRWPAITWSEDYNSSTDVHLLNSSPSNAIETIEKMNLGNSLFFFDPLLYSPWSEIEKVARTRIKWYYQTGTEFILFLFTSDWFQGRGDMVGLPTRNDEKWTEVEQQTIAKVDDLFGNRSWRSHLLVSKSTEERMKIMVDLYRAGLHKWFRYVLPFPFKPKPNQMYHLFMCSNYETGVRLTRNFYSDYTANPKYLPDNEAAYSKFIQNHREKKMKGRSRSDEWKFLWSIITEHEEGLCDIYCKDLASKQAEVAFRRQTLDWLKTKGYMTEIDQMTNAWPNPPKLYKLNWSIVRTTLGIDSPEPFKPLEPRKRKT